MKNGKLTVVKILLLVLTLAVMAFIFQMSAMDAENSSELSSSVGYTVGEVVIDGFNRLPPAEQEQYVERIEHPLRKLAHYVEFAVLGLVLVFDCLVFAGLEGFRRFAVAFILGIIYAATDELHQLVVSGRSSEIKDVMIDAGGVLSGCMLACLIIFIVHVIIDLRRKQTV